MILFIIIEDACIYWVHRFLHTNLFYKKIHKYHHIYTNPVSYVSHYMHPLEFLLKTIFPTIFNIGIKLKP